MSETLRDLVVSLSLSTDNFTRNIKSVNKQIAEAESRFKLAAAGVEGFEKSASVLGSQIGSLRQKLVSQRQAVEQYQRALTAADAKLQSSVANHGKFSASLESARTKQAALRSEVDRAAKQVEQYRATLGASDSATIAAESNLEALTAEYAGASEEVTKLEGQVVATGKAMQKAADDYTQARTNLNNATAAVRETNAEISKLSKQLAAVKSALRAAGDSLTAFGKSATAAGKALTPLGRDLTRYVTTPIAGLGAFAIKSAIDFEDAFAGVRKTVSMTKDEYTALDASIKRMTLVKPADYEAIAAVAEAAGQLGVANHAIEGFTSVMTDLGAVSTDLSAEDAATNLAKLANIMGVTGDKQTNEYFERMGSAVLGLGVNSAATEAGIVEMSMRLAAAGKQVGLTEPQIIGFATALSSVGIEAQMGGTAFSKALIKMELAVENGGQSLKDFAKVSGLTADEFSRLFKSDPAAAFEAFIAGLAKMDDEGVSAISTLQDIGFKEVRLRDTTLRMVNATELMSSTQSIANKAWKDNSAITTRVAERYNTTANRLKMLNNRAQLTAATFGEVMLPTMEDVIAGASDFLDGFAEMDEGQRKALISTAAWIAAIGPAILLVGKLNTGIGTVSSALGKLLLASTEAGGGATGMFSALKGLLGPAGIAAVAAAALYGAYKWYDFASGAAAAREATKGMIDTAEQWQSTQAKTLYDTGNDPFTRFGIDESAFSSGVSVAKTWLDAIRKVWSDGTKDSKSAVNEYIDQFTAGSDEVREAIKSRQATQEKYGVKDDKTATDDLKKLKAYDKEVAALLKKRRNKTLTEDDQKRLEQIVQERVEIKLRYITGEGGGYDSITRAVEAEKARLTAEGQSPGSDLYGDALSAAATGYKAQVDSINQSYDDQFADLQAISDEKEKQDALDQLNLEHVEQLKVAHEAYNKVMGQYAAEAFKSPEIQQAQTDMEKLRQLIATFQSDGVVTGDELTQLKAFTDSLDEGKLASYLALLKQIDEGGLGDLNLGTEEAPIKASDLLGGYDTVAAFLQANSGTFEGLAGMFGAADAEANRVLLDIGITPEGQAVKDWVDNHETFTLTETASLDFTGLDQATLDAFYAANPDKKPSVVMDVGLKTGWAEALQTAYANGTLQVFGANGAQLTVTPEVLKRIGPTDIFLEGMTDEHGNALLGVVITQKLGTKEAVDAADSQLKQVPENFLPDWLKSSTSDKVTSIQSLVQGVEDLTAAGETLGAQQGKSVLLDQLMSLNADDLKSISGYIAAAMTALSSGTLSDTDAANVQAQLDAMLTVVKTADEYFGVGNDISAGIAGGMTTYGWMGDATTVASSIETALRAASQTHSPSTMTLPIGVDLAAGVAVGMMAYGFGSAAGVTAAKAISALRAGMSSDATRPIGRNAMVGMAAGILSGQNLVVNSMRIVAEAAVRAAKAKLKIQSPSKVFRDEVGRMMVRGIGEGTILESKAQAKIIQNAARYLTGAAQAGVGGTSSYDNRRTYHQDQSVTVQVEKLYVRDEKDVRSLAIELAQFNKTQYAGMGVR